MYVCGVCPEVQRTLSRYTLVRPSQSEPTALKTTGKNITAGSRWCSHEETVAKERLAFSAAERSFRPNGKEQKGQAETQKKKTEEKLREARFTRHSARNGFYCKPFIKPGYFAHASVLDEAIKARADSRYNLFVAELHNMLRTRATSVNDRQEVNCVYATLTGRYRCELI